MLAAFARLGKPHDLSNACRERLSSHQPSQLRRHIIVRTFFRACEYCNFVSYCIAAIENKRRPGVARLAGVRLLRNYSSLATPAILLLIYYWFVYLFVYLFVGSLLTGSCRAMGGLLTSDNSQDIISVDHHPSIVFHLH